MKNSILKLGTPVLLSALLAAPPTLAGPKGGGGSRGQASSSVNRNTNKNVNVNQNKNVNRNTNVNVNRDVDVDVDVHHHGGYYGGGCCYHPVATAAAVTTAAIVTAAVIGSTVNTLPVGCTTVVVNGLAYQQCGSTWYQPQYYGSSVSYVVVGRP
jgi:hypothetical protein